MAQKNRPAKEIRFGKHHGCDGDEWKVTSSFRRDDLPIVSKAADMAYARIWEQESPTRQVRDEDE